MNPTTVRLASIEVENIRCFEHARLDLRERPWTVILGDNGTGKSTLLRAIALALSSPKDSTFLFEQGHTSWIRNGQKLGRIACEVLINGERARSELLIQRESYGERLVPDADQAFWTIWDRPPFVAGYGATRGAIGSSQTRSER